MTGGSHQIAGVGMAMIAHRLVPLGGTPLAIGAAFIAVCIGAYLPDIDSDNSRIRQMTGTATRRSPIIGGLVSLAVRALFGSHREGTHRPEAWVVASLPALALSFAWLIAPVFPQADFLILSGNFTGIAWGFSIGYLSHLIADGMTRHGIPAGFLALLTGRKQFHTLPRGLRIVTGGVAEYVVVAGLVVGIMLSGLWRVW